ncbi:PREDICTED: protein FAM35A isoform X2 [Condylura cristata]|nr:PREDICTED: protein FAM35A isoform X2 [Condylura cristata]XP_012579381.1 PREDICTED: protein FAM35A isoform X2 [Condylura cristata]XP_012579382.1 PREDICTED: protein FAM35A isoform X2 [Condylura cristata]XP_012579383.1 PREDICTED: protein FAM35A isoform X2 [Condylura cristata]XP_012579384.1 PREDICTED: protein FAM35A isoform X2 [Condylura cristata]XP_012579385.1 PREDICTED: protein FAM35A isoform X2 [Condylura cristata]XP_012579386.1 PREDICTED: protein FAM35A isoform X2 [Condylura cristata]XP_0
MNEGSQVHIFWGAPVGPLKMTVSLEPPCLASTTDPWKQIQVLYNQHSLQLKDNKCKHKNLEDSQVLDAVGPPDLPNDRFLAHSVTTSLHVNDDFIPCISETQTVKSQIYPCGMSGVTNFDVQECGFKGKAQHLTEEDKYQKICSESKTITDERQKDQSDICAQNFKKYSFQLDSQCVAMLDSICSPEQINIEPGTVQTKTVPTEHQESQNQCLEFSFNPIDKQTSVGTVRKISVSTDTEFLSIMTSSQVAFLTQKKYKGLNSMNTGTMNLETELKSRQGERRVTEDNLIQPNDDFVEKGESEENQACSLELFSPVCPETESSHSYINPEKCLEENIGLQKLSTSRDKLPPNEICIESCNSGILCSQLNTLHKSSIKRSWTSEDKLGLSKSLSKDLQISKKIKLASNARAPALDLTVAVNQRKVSPFKSIKKTSLIKNCESESQKYNCLVMVLSPCHVKEINIKSGPNSGSTVPLATIVVIDQSEIKKKVVLWRTAAFWALTVFLGDIILLTDVTIHEDHWLGETVLQSTFTSQLLNLGSYSSVQPEEYSKVVSDTVLQDLLAYVSSKHSYLRDLPRRQSQKINSIEFVELEQLQPDTLVHAVLRIVDIIVLTEELYSYRGQKQRKVMLTVEQAQGQHYVLVLWGPGAAWYPQLQRKKDYIWEFKYLYVQRNCILENLELHTTYWSSCECLFHDDLRAIAFKAKFHKSTPSFVKMSYLEKHLEDKCSGIILIKAQILELVFFATSTQKIVLNAHSSLKSIYASLSDIIYIGCAKCGLELETDENKIYKECFSCLPFTVKKIYYRPALMTIRDGRNTICVHVGSKLIEKILLNIPPDYLNRVIAPSSEITYGLVTADLFHSLLAGGGAPGVMKVQSLFVLDENSYPLQQDFSLLDFYPDNVRHPMSFSETSEEIAGTS